MVLASFYYAGWKIPYMILYGEILFEKEEYVSVFTENEEIKVSGYHWFSCVEIDIDDEGDVVELFKKFQQYRNDEKS